MKIERKKIKIEKYYIYFQAMAMALLPLLCCMIACGLEGRSIKHVYLPSSLWNDELFYFKQVEGILGNGIPQGYFGFNESKALYFSFAAWSPVLVLPWIIFGILFGWTVLTPIYCNIVLMMLAMFFFVLIVKPSLKQLGILTLLFLVFTPFTRYMLSGMPEVICFSLLILYFACLVRHVEEEGNKTLVGTIVIAILLTLMRPYLVLFLILPLFFWVKKNKIAGFIGGGFLLLVTLGIYFLINRFLGAAYFTPLFKTDWLAPLLRGEIGGGIKEIIVKLYYEGSTFLALTKEAFLSGIAEGAIFAAFLGMMLLFLLQSVADYFRGRNKCGLINGYLGFTFFGMWMALLLMYKMKEGSKHLLTFLVVGIFGIALMKTKFYRKAIFISGLMVYLFTMKATDPYDYQIPFSSQERMEQINYWEEVFNKELILDTENGPSYDNVIIWLFDDYVEAELVQTRWQNLYALPTGFGISCAYREYVLDNFDSLKSKYIMLPTGGEIERMCSQEGMYLVGQDEEVSVYELRR